MNYKETLSYIHSLGMFSLPASLDRIKSVLKKLDNPQTCLKTIHVAGTNGKGSVCTFISSVLSASGLNVGLFTSPFIMNFRERVQINGEYISEDALCRLSQIVKGADIKLTEFEFITAVAFLYFKEQNCDVVVLETGLGGRFDATNVCENVICNVITKIGLDHTDILGDTINQIAEEKCGIIKCDNVISDPSQDMDALSVIKRYVPDVTLPDVKNIKVLNSDIMGSLFIYEDNTYNICMAGEHQIYNAVVAIEAVKCCGLNISNDYIANGLRTAFIPARLEVLSKNPPIIVDGAHNPDAADVLSQFIRQYENKAVAVFSAMRDKNYKAVMQKTLPLFSSVVVVKLDMPRAETAENLTAAAKPYCRNVIAAKDISEALSIAQGISHGAPIVVFGSLYLASDVRSRFK